MTDPWTLGEKAITELLGQLDAERALADDLAEGISDAVLDGLIPFDRVKGLLARYRKARGR